MLNSAGFGNRDNKENKEFIILIFCGTSFGSLRSRFHNFFQMQSNKHGNEEYYNQYAQDPFYQYPEEGNNPHDNHADEYGQQVTFETQEKEYYYHPKDNMDINATLNEVSSN